MSKIKLRLVTISIWIFIFGVSLFPVAAARPEITLRFCPQKGQSFHMLEYMDFRFMIPGNELIGNMNIAVGIGYTMKVVNTAENGDIDTLIKIEAIKLKMPGILGQSGNYDSTDPFLLPSTMSMSLALMEGCELETKYNSQGKQLDVKISEPYLERVVQQVAENDPEQQASLKEQLRTSLTGSFSGAEKQYAEGIYEGKPLAVGDTMEQVIDTGQNGFMFRQQMFYTLKKISDGVAYFNIKSKILALRTENGYTLPNFLKSSGNLKGTLEVFIDSGQVKRMNVQLYFEGTFDAQASQRMSCSLTYLIKPFGEN